jgi:hypothetical protein
MKATRHVVRGLAAMGIVTMIVVFAQNAHPNDGGWWYTTFLFALWEFPPYVALLALAPRLPESKLFGILLAIAAFFECVPVPLLAYDAFVLHPSSLTAVLFLYVPLYQELLIAPFMIAAWLVGRRERRARSA